LAENGAQERADDEQLHAFHQPEMLGFISVDYKGGYEELADPGQ